MISQLTSPSFDQMLPPPPSTAPATVVSQLNDCAGDGGGGGGCVPTIGHHHSPVAADQHGINGCRKRKRSSASKDNVADSGDGTANGAAADGSVSCASFSTESAEGGSGASPKLVGVEQQLVASSPSLFLQQALRQNNMLMEGMGTGGQDDAEDEHQQQQQGTGMATLDFFEAHKAFQKLSNQLGGAGFSTADSVPSPATVQQSGMIPFVQHLATLSPFLLAMQHQSLMQAQQHQFDPATLLSMPQLHNASENLFNPMASSPLGGYGKEEEEEEGEEEERRSHSDGANPAGEPEDLSLKNDGRSTNGHQNSNSSSSGDNPNRNGTPWSYEEQFKQLYELSPTDLSRKEWLDDWLEYMRRIGKPVTRIPIMAKQVLDLYELYRLVVHHGGLVEVITKKLWREIAKGLSLPTSITSAAFTLRTQYEKYLFDYECHQHKFSTLEELRAAIEANRRESRRNGPLPTATTTPSNSAGATPAGGQQQHNHPHHPHTHPNNTNNHHHYSGGRHSATNPTDSHREQQQRHVQQQQMRLFEQMAASFGTAVPPPPMVAAAFFGKQLMQFGGTATDGMPMMARALAEDEIVQQNGGTNSRAPSSSQSLPQFAASGAMAPFQLGHQNGDDPRHRQQQKFDSIFPKIDFGPNGRSSTSPRAFGQRQNATSGGAQQRRWHNNNKRQTNEREGEEDGTIPTATTSSDQCGQENQRQQKGRAEETAHTAEKRRKLSDPSIALLGPASSAGRSASSPHLTTTNGAIDDGPPSAAPLPLGPFDQLLKNASRCNIKVNNGGGEAKSAGANGNSRPVVTLPPATTTFSSGTNSPSMVMSMEINGVLYQGVLFAMPNPDREATDEEVAERQNGCKI